MFTVELYEPANRLFRFDEVGESQFFIDSLGRLCQKDDNTQYWVIANENGTPLGILIYPSSDAFVRRILPKVKKISWEN